MAASVNIADVQDDLINRLLANLPTGFTQQKVKLPNKAFTTPNDKWLRATFNAPVAIDVDASGCYKEFNGFFVIDVFYAKGTWPREAALTAQQITDAFTNKAFAYSSTINCDMLSLGELDNWNQWQVIVTYQYGSYSGE